MTHGERTRAACLTGAFEENAGFAIDPRSVGWFGQPGEWKWFYRVSSPADVTDAKTYPAIAEARQHYASMSPERRAELEGDW